MYNKLYYIFVGWRTTEGERRTTGGGLLPTLCNRQIVDAGWWMASDGNLIGGKDLEIKVEKRVDFKIPCEEVKIKIHYFEAKKILHNIAWNFKIPPY